MATQTTSSAVDAYLSDTISLVRSLVIKSEITAQRINNELIAKYGQDAVSQDEPWTWKYYMNMSGRYHKTDQMMQVISLDTHETIDFTVQNLEIHTATAREYRYGTRYYYSLARRYPSQVPLILAITNPTNINVAIDAEDGTVLNWDRSFVEGQEDTLILDIEKYVKNYLIRYTVIGFNKTWSYYPVFVIAGLYMSLPAKIMNIRLGYCKTEKTHSFHMRQYLASHGHLDRFIPYLTFEQVLYLYHNIDRLNKFAGHTATFKELIHWILFIRRVPLSEFTIRQLQMFDLEKLPLLRARRTALSSLENTAEAQYVDMEVFFDKEEQTEPGNKRYFEVALPRIVHELQTYNGSIILTKDLESAMVDYTNAVPDPLPSVLMRQWAYMASHDMYNVLVSFNNPATGEAFSLLAKDALIYYCYLFLRSYNIEVTEVPKFLNVKFRLNPLPSLEELEADIPDQFPELYLLAEQLLSRQPRLFAVTSTSRFWEVTQRIYQEAFNHWFIKGATQNPLKRGVVGWMISKLYGLEFIELGKGTTMKAWLTENNMPEYDLTREEAATMMRQIFENATGFAVDDTKSLKAIQKALLELFGQQSSYAIQFMREINDSDIIPLAWADIRIGVDSQESSDNANILAPVRIQDVLQQSHDNVSVPIADILVKPVLDQMTHEALLDPSVFINVVGKHEVEVNLPVQAVRIYDPDVPANGQTSRFLPMTYYDRLTKEQIDSIAYQHLDS